MSRKPVFVVAAKLKGTLVASPTIVEGCKTSEEAVTDFLFHQSAWAQSLIEEIRVVAWDDMTKAAK